MESPRSNSPDADMTPRSDKIAKQWGWEPHQFDEFIETMTKDLDAWVESANCHELWVAPTGTAKTTAHRAQLQKIMTYIQTSEPMLDPVNKIYDSKFDGFQYSHGDTLRYIVKQCQQRSQKGPKKTAKKNRPAGGQKNAGTRKRAATMAFEHVEPLFQPPKTIRIWSREHPDAPTVKNVTVSSDAIEKPADVIAQVIANTSEHPGFHRLARRPDTKWVMLGMYDHKLPEDEIAEFQPTDANGNPVSYQNQTVVITDRNSLRSYCTQYELEEPIDPAKPKTLPLIRTLLVLPDNTTNAYPTVDLTESSFKRTRIAANIEEEETPGDTPAQIAERQRQEKAANEEAERVLRRAERIKNHKANFEAAVAAAKAALQEAEPRVAVRDAKVKAEHDIIDAEGEKGKNGALAVFSYMTVEERNAPDSTYRVALAGIEKKVAASKKAVDDANPVPVFSPEEKADLEQKIKDAENDLAQLTDDFYNPEGYPINEDSA